MFSSFLQYAFVLGLPASGKNLTVFFGIIVLIHDSGLNIEVFMIRISWAMKHFTKYFMIAACKLCKDSNKSDVSAFRSITLFFV